MKEEVKLPIKYNKPIMRNLYRDVYIKKTNALIGVTGAVGTGKSYTAVRIGFLFDGKFDIKKNVVYNVRDLLVVCFGSLRYKGKQIDIDLIKKMGTDEFKEFLTEEVSRIRVSPGRVAVFDEAGSGAYVREFFSLDNKTISKLIMMIRFLRMIIIFVVPEDLKFMESTVSTFLNYKITMVGTPDKVEGAKCFVNKLHGWNQKTKEPFKPRLPENKGRGGHIMIKCLPENKALEYEKIARIKKIEAMSELWLEYQEKPKGRNDKDISNVVDKIVKEKERFIRVWGKTSHIPVKRIMTLCDVPERTAMRIKIIAEDKLELDRQT